MTKVVNISKSSDIREDCDVYIGRPSIYGNPFIMGVHGTREDVIAKYSDWIDGLIPAPKGQLTPTVDEIWKLKGKRLGCFCKPKDCHGDILATLAN